MEFYVYILYSKTFDKYYIGQTNNIEIRLVRHNAVIEKATAPYRPWEMIWYVNKSTRLEAMMLEKKLKNLSKQRIIDFIRKYS